MADKYDFELIPEWTTVEELCAARGRLLDKRQAEINKLRQEVVDLKAKLWDKVHVLTVSKELQAERRNLCPLQ